MRYLLLFMLLTVSKNIFSQQGFSKKIIVVKVYNDSLLEEENTCFKSSSINLIKIGTSVKLDKFKEYDAYVLDNTELDSVEINFLNLRLPLKTVSKKFSNEFVYEFSIYLNYQGQNNVFTLSYTKGAIYRDANYKNAFYRVNLNFPHLSFSAQDKKFVSSSKHVPSEMLNKNIEYFFSK